MNEINWETATQEEIKAWCRKNEEDDFADFFSKLPSIIKILEEAYND